ncbi:mCG1026607 [Mus musculus]|nr:mCG1026607 [Mus musculus]
MLHKKKQISCSKKVNGWLQTFNKKCMCEKTVFDLDD